ncbi:MAG: DNA polymerase III subunit delta' [Selenomonadaceae bacterium]|nr:DNA polymerase III subunit delta' [Selenomonadaceae bacterium]
METSWSVILGHKNQVGRLRKLLKSDKLPHAMLFTGASGIGKSLVAEVLAASILCQSEGDVACGICQSCRAFKASTHPDFHRLVPMTKDEWDGKKEKSRTAKRIIRLEQLKKMQADIAMVPALSPLSVVVIESAETMNQEAANSLLKTIEEPDGPVVFILTTAFPAALLDTVISRCMRMEFGVLSHQDVEELLRRQGVDTDRSALLAALSDGSIGDALKLNQDEIIELRKKALDIVDQMSEYDMDDIWQLGKELGQLSREQLSQLLSFQIAVFRDMLVLYSCSDGLALYNQGDYARLSSLIEKYSVCRTERLLRLVREAQQKLRSNVNARLLMEGLFIKMKDV